MSLVRQALRGFLELVYPGLCGLCGHLLSADEPHFCHSCLSKLTHDDTNVCPRCAGTVGPFARVEGGCAACRQHRLHFEQVFRLGPYDGVLRDAILRMKYHAGEELAELVAEVWAERLAPKVADLN